MRLIIIGAGPGGYETAVAAASKGIEVTIVSDGPVGGTCLNEGCIPTKCLCRNAALMDDLAKASIFGLENLSYVFDFKKVISRKEDVVIGLRQGVEFLLKGKNITLLRGRASFKDDHTVKVALEDGSQAEVSGDYIIIATGSQSAMLPIPGAELCITSKEILGLEKVPERLCIIGAGVIGLEFASIFKSFGSEVTVLEYCKEILPRFDTDLSKRLKQALSKRGIAIETSAQVLSVEKCDGGFKVNYQKKDAPAEAKADVVLMAVGRRPATGSLNLSDAGIEFTPKGIVVDKDMRTNVPHIFAIGDITGGYMLAHVATFQGKPLVQHVQEIIGGIQLLPRGISFIIQKINFLHVHSKAKRIGCRIHQVGQIFLIDGMIHRVRRKAVISIIGSKQQRRFPLAMIEPLDFIVISRLFIIGFKLLCR